MTQSPPKIVLTDLHPKAEDFREQVLAGLMRTPKVLPCKFLYDERGSQLFDRICETADYYPTRTELGIMREHIGEIVATLGPGCRLIEFGSGSSLKTQVLLENLQQLASYLPLDISREHLMSAAHRIAKRFPSLPVHPVCADYLQTITDLPGGEHATHTVVYFPGSTIGNFTRPEARDFLARIARLCGKRGGLLIGVDLRKDVGILHRAYNDSEGVTAQFSLNLLERINRELDADFDPERFRHRAFFDDKPSRIEVQIVSEIAQSVRVAGQQISFALEEAITTEYSHKYTIDDFAALAYSAGFSVREVWTDERRLFSVQYCERM